jgi:hypothetical protein
MRRSALAAAALALTALSVESRAGCATVSDPAGDVAIAPRVVVPDQHLDLRALTIRPSGSAVVVTFRTTALSDARKGTWRLTFTSRGATLFVTAGLGAWANVGSVGSPNGFRAGIAGNPGRTVTGAVDYRTSSIVVTVPYATFGGRLTGRDRAIANVAVSAEETVLNVGAGSLAEQVSLTDDAHAARLAITRC